MQSSSIVTLKHILGLIRKVHCAQAVRQRKLNYIFYISQSRAYYMFFVWDLFFFFYKPQDPVLPPIWKSLLYFAIACTIESFTIKPWMYEKVILIRINFDFLLTWNHAIRFHSHTATKSTAAYFAVLAIYCKHTHTHTHTHTQKFKRCQERFAMHCIGQRTLTSIFLHSFMDSQTHLYHRLTAASPRITIPIMIQAPSQISSLQPKASPFAKTKQRDLSFFPSSSPQQLSLHFLKHLPERSHP